MTTTNRARKYTSVGGYPLFYISQCNNVLCADCVDQLTEEEPEAVTTPAVNWECTNLHCDECSTKIGSAYSEE